jgi:hypothetical protein
MEREIADGPPHPYLRPVPDNDPDDAPPDPDDALPAP